MEVRGINSETVADEDDFDLFVEKPNALRSLCQSLTPGFIKILTM